MTNKMFAKFGAWDDALLAIKPITARVPLHVMARLTTICELFPNKTRTDIIIELIKGGLEKFEESMPPIHYREIAEQDGISFKHPEGPRQEYQKGSNYNFSKLESEMKIKSAGPLFADND